MTRTVGPWDRGTVGPWDCGTVGPLGCGGSHRMGRDYRKIVAWQRAHELTLSVYRETGHFPIRERYGLTMQVRRAVYSVPANISEGSGRDSHKDYLRFLLMALSSLKEAEYFLLLARDLGYLRKKKHALLTELVNGTFGALQGLIKAVKKEAGGQR